MIKKKVKKTDKVGKKIRKIDNYNFFYRNFKIALYDFKKIKVYFWILTFLFFFSTLVGFLFPVFFVEQIMEMLLELVKRTEGMGTFDLIRFIMTNNTQSAFLAMIFGLVLGIFPLFMITINGYILGFVSRLTVDQEGFFILWRLLPHGIFEIPAILIATALGLRLGFLLMHEVIKVNSKNIKTIWEIFIILFSVLFWYVGFFVYLAFTFSSKELRTGLWINIKESFRIFVFVVIPLLVVAGIIEGLLIGFGG